jgi:hypothetical protein
MRKIILTFEDRQMTALEVLSKKEHRSAWQQATLIVCQELERQRLLTVTADALVGTAPAPSTIRELDNPPYHDPGVPHGMDKETLEE